MKNIAIAESSQLFTMAHSLSLDNVTCANAFVYALKIFHPYRRAQNVLQHGQFRIEDSKKFCTVTWAHLENDKKICPRCARQELEAKHSPGKPSNTPERIETFDTTLPPPQPLSVASADERPTGCSATLRPAV